MVAATKYFTSADGKTWDEVTIDDASFPIGARHEMIVHNNKLYIVGYLTITDPWGIGYYLP